MTDDFIIKRFKGYSVKGIFKAGWLRKHHAEVPAAIIYVAIVSSTADDNDRVQMEVSFCLLALGSFVFLTFNF